MKKTQRDQLKRWTSSLLALVMVCSMLPAQVFAAGDALANASVEGQSEETCTHADAEIIPAVAATCTTGGWTEGLLCSDCGYMVSQTAIPATGHTVVKDPAVAPTCTENGKTEGEHCSVCNEVLTAQKTVQFLGHTVVDDPAVAPTCTETGKTAGKHCSVCGTVITAQQEVAATGHAYTTEETLPGCETVGYITHTCANCGDSYTTDEVGAKGHAWDEGLVTTTPTCEEAGVRTRTCSNCGGTEEVVEAALGHQLEYVSAKQPTYSAVGWEAYERCTREDCGHTTYAPIPMLERSDISDYASFMESLKILEGYANDYVKENPGKDPAMLVIKYIRTGVDRYNSGSWNIMAGYEDTGFAEYVNDREDEYNSAMASVEDMIQVASLKNINNFELPSGELTDIGHMFGTMDISYTNVNSVNHADVGGWTGDLVDLLSLADQFGVTGTLEEMIETISADYFLKSSFPEEPIEGTFSQTDFYGDLDAFYVMQQLTSQDYTSGRIYEILDKYFTESLTDEDRAAFLLENRLGDVAGRSDIRDAVYEAYTKNQVIATLEGTREFKSEDLSDLRRACCYVFADYLCKLAGDYVVVGENIYYDVFQTEKSILAPGITQEINYAYTADDKQIRYYIATADINSQYVDVYANYKDNDPSLGWGMQRVRDQAEAAQARRSDPESDVYVPNYTVIAAINGAGYDMSTGEPGGLLIMDGEQYHAPNSNGFFGILKDGTAKIGTTEEYYELYEQGLVKEGISAFGSTLVKDGKVAITGTSDYYTSRASRTAVGITKTGRVVFMVLDGRQEPVSCGGSMEEIAQIMLEAGCVEAVNLDGGGSTTYIAKQAGDDELSLVSSPSDGFERSVSTSLIMVSTAPSSTEFDHAVLEAETAYLTVGAQTQITASGVSPMGNAVEIPEGTVWAVADESIGSVTEDGVFTAKANGDVDVNLMLDGEIVGSITVHVKQPTAIYFTRDEMDAVYGVPAKMPLKALYDGKEMAIVEGDIQFTLSNTAAGSFEGFSFTGDAASGIKSVTVTAKLVSDSNITATIKVALFNADEYSFGFENATGGDRQLAWLREVSNATTTDNITYTVDNLDQDMVASYSFGIDMTQIPMPEQLEDLTYMLPGADVEGNNTAWSFLLQLAERISVMSYVQPVIRIDENLDVDYSGLTIACEYFELDEVNGVVFDEETNELVLTLHWIDQTKAIDPETANPICVVSGIKLTPKDDAPWDEKDRLTVVNSGEIGYKIYMRANALYTFSQKPENQEIYGLEPFVNPNDETEKGGGFQSVYKEFEDSYTMINGLKNGWVNEEGGYAYYEEGVRLTGIHKIGEFYYDFGETGINVGQEKYSGLFEENGIAHYAKFGVLTTGWVTVGESSYCFDENCNGYDGTFTIDEVEMVFEKGKLVGGYTGFITKTDGNTYHYQNGAPTYGWYQDGDILYHFNTGTGVMTTGTHVCPDAEAKAKGAYYDFADDGETLRGYFNPSGYYYWAGLPLTDSWVKEGSDPDADAWYHTNSHGHYVTDPTGDEVFALELDGVTYDAVKIEYDGVVYTFDNNSGKLLLGDIVVDGTNRYYYWAGEPFTGGWVELNGETYYALESGKLATGNQVIDGQNYVFDGEGKLITNGTSIIATLSEGGEKMTVQLKGAEEGLEKVIFAVWADSLPQADTLTWVENATYADGVWSVTIPMCQSAFYGVTGVYNIHAFGNTNFITNTTANVSVAGEHTYTDGTDTTCDLCGYVRELTELAMTATMTGDNKQMLVKLGGADEALTNVRVYVWPDGSNQSETMCEVDAVKGTDGIWTAAIPMCQPAFGGLTGTYNIHAYDIAQATPEMLANITAQVAAAVEHTYTDDADTTCDLCGYEREIAHVHTWSAQWSSNETHHWHECTAADCDVTENSGKDGYAEHTYADATDTTCDCGYVREIAHVHTWSAQWSSNATHHWHECTAADCDVTENSGKDGYAEHTYADATDATCDCGYVREIAHVHAWSGQWSSNATHHWHECTAAGCTVTAVSAKDGYGEHSYTDETDAACDCGYVREITLENELKGMAADKDNLTEEEIRDAFQAMDTDELKSAMQADQNGTGVMADIAELEEAVGGSVEVVVTPEAQEFDVEKVTIVGANLNSAISAEPITLVIDKPEEDRELDAVYDSTVAVKFSMDLTNVADSENLDVPVMITLPIPASIDPEKLVILHYHADGEVEVVAEPSIYETDGQWYASFVLVSFSDFVMTQLVEECSHTGGTATCLEQATCASCGVKYGEKNMNNHAGQANWTRTAENHSKAYACCGAVVVAQTAHTWDGNTCSDCGYEREEEIVATTPMYRLYNPNSGEHFYTGSIEERDMLVSVGWHYEGVAWNAPTKSGDPVYRLFNPNNGDHHYTMSAEERDMLVGVGWIYEGVAWNSAGPDKLPLYRLFNPNADCGSHHYTGSTEERDFLVSVGWIYEGIGWFGLLK